ncbi:siderophore-interacting protein, partial [Microbacterium yannicii]|uniref:siderophore-interacting protein n=1 Tax=Microbacterium yannicii TaxID=671622 RepID=UPI0003604819
ESVVIIDEGLAFNPDRGVDRVVLVADETGLPAIAGVAASLPAGATGVAIIEVPSAEDALDFVRPAGLSVEWIVREYGTKPGMLALRALTEATLPDAGFHAYIVGEQALPTDARRHLVGERGVPKDLVSFCGYWRVGAASPAPRSQRATAETPA